jgi:hypothetical protein
VIPIREEDALASLPEMFTIITKQLSRWLGDKCAHAVSCIIALWPVQLKR